ncbi:malate dehydrogenase, mitochondrial-like [Syzygium oleosum]|uniref:malate dehydrogenase, mitochondrial-like n=1 Tax=Syzygium oleosum TaxID=219896 RepID=UPI0011D21F70|nr:malate dehydrogenase, mitochondrial-like [Syzygium oleosum]
MAGASSRGGGDVAAAALRRCTATAIHSGADPAWSSRLTRPRERDGMVVVYGDARRRLERRATDGAPAVLRRSTAEEEEETRKKVTGGNGEKGEREWRVNVPVVGGHAGITIVPLFSQAVPKANLADEDIKAPTKRTQDGGTKVVQAKAGKGSATLSMAYAGALFADACLKDLNGVPDVVECSFVQSSITELPFFASKVKLGKNGVEEVLELGPMSDFEKQGLESLILELKSSIEKGIKFGNQ